MPVLSQTIATVQERTPVGRQQKRGVPFCISSHQEHILLASALMLQRRGKFGYKEMQKCRRMATHQQLPLNKKVPHHIGAGPPFSI
jgi:hypothetical protein